MNQLLLMTFMEAYFIIGLAMALYVAVYSSKCDVVCIGYE